MLTITLPPELEARLRDAASRKGVDAADYATDLINKGLYEPGRSLVATSNIAHLSQFVPAEQWDRV